MELTRKTGSTSNTVYAVAYAQLIVDHFGKALQENGCMVQFPVSLYLEFDDHYHRLVGYIESAINTGNIGGGGYKLDEDSIRGDGDNINETIREAIKKASNDCFNCKIEKPKFDFSGIFGNLMFDIQHSLDQFKNMFKYNKASMCQYAFFLSYMCIPDLLKLISLILAALVKLLQNISLPRLTVAVFINGILSAIIEVLTRNIAILARFALTPVLCILDAIDSIIAQLPTPENIRAQNEHELRKLGASENFMSGKYDTGLAQKSAKIREQYVSRVRGLEQSATQNTQKYVQEIFGPLEQTIQKSVDSLNNSIAELTGLLNHFTCEPDRSGISVSQYLTNVSEFMALVNLLRYIIRFKAGKAAFDKVCNTPTDGSNWGNNNDTSGYGGLTIDNIGSIISDIIGSDIDIITNDNGDPIAIGIRDPDSNKEKADNLSFWSCNLNDFSDSLLIPNIINDIIDLDLPSLDIPEWNPSPWTVTIVPESEYTKPTPNTEIVPLVIDEVWNLPGHIKDILDMLDTYNPTDDPSNGINDVDFIGENSINDIINNVSIKDPNGNPIAGINNGGDRVRISSDGDGVKIQDGNGNDLSGNGASPSAIDSVDKIISRFKGGYSVTGQLDCVTDVQNIINKLGE